jgi:hypothetical protein
LKAPSLVRTARERIFSRKIEKLRDDPISQPGEAPEVGSKFLRSASDEIAGVPALGDAPPPPVEANA